MWRIVLIVSAFIRLTGATTFAGRVVEDHSGNPIPRVEVRITRIHASGPSAELETDADGRFRISELPDSEYTIRFSKADHSAVEITTHGRAGMLLWLTRFGAISGKISDFEGHPIANAQVAALTPSEEIAGTVDMNAPSGEYRIYGLRPGSYRVAVLTSGGVRSRRGIALYPNNSAPRDFTVSGGEEYTGADISLAAGPVFRLTARAESTEARSVLFTLVSAEHPGRQLAQQLVPVDRPFTVESVVPGNYELLASGTSPTNSSSFGRAPVNLVAANLDDIHVRLDQVRSASFSLQLREPCVADALVELKTIEAWLGRPTSVTIHAGKLVDLTALAPARYSISAEPSRGDCYATVTREIDLTRDSASKPVEIVLAPLGSIQGYLTGTARAVDYVVVLTSRYGSWQRICFPDASGEFEFSAVPPGSYLAFAAGRDVHWAPSRQATALEVSGGTPVTLQLHPPDGSR